MEPMAQAAIRYAAIDLGSNSFRLHVGEFSDGQVHILHSARNPIRFGAGLDASMELTELAMRSALQCLAEFGAQLRRFHLTGVRAVATNTLRVARNAAEFLPRAEAALGCSIEIISGEEEGRLIYMGVASVLDRIPAQQNQRRLVIDIGGGSTELIVGCGKNITAVDSFSIGTVRQGMSFFTGGRIDRGSFEAAIASSRACFEDAVSRFGMGNWDAAYGSSGTMRAISGAVRKNALGDGCLSLTALNALREALIDAGHVSRVSMVGVKPERVSAICGGLAILLGAMQEFGIETLQTVDAGLRTGVLWDMRLRATEQDRRAQAVQACRVRFQASEARAERLATDAGCIYDAITGLEGSWRQSVVWAASLHEIGLAVSHTGFHKHSAYLIEHADLSGFTKREQTRLAQLVLGHKGNLHKLGAALSDPEFVSALVALRLAAIFLHAGVDLVASNLRLRHWKRIDLEISDALLRARPTLAFALKRESRCWADVGIAMEIKAT